MPPRRLPPGFHELLIPAFFVTDEASPELARWKQEHRDWFEAGTWEQPRAAARGGGAGGQAGATGAEGGRPEAEMADAGAPPRTVAGAARVAGYFGASVAPVGVPRRRPVGAATARRLALGRFVGPSPPVIPVQFEPEPPERRAPVGRLLTPEEEIRESRFSTALDAIRRLEPNNPELTFVRDPDRTIPEESVRQVEHEAELARQRNVVVGGRVLPVEPPEKRANDAAGADDFKDGLGLAPGMSQSLPKPSAQSPTEEPPGTSRLQTTGDLTAEEIRRIQAVVDQAGRPLDVVGSAAKGTRRPGSDIDYSATQSSLPYFKGLEGQLPSIDPLHGIVPGGGNPFMGPVIRFEPKS